MSELRVQNDTCETLTLKCGPGQVVKISPKGRFTLSPEYWKTPSVQELLAAGKLSVVDEPIGPPGPQTGFEAVEREGGRRGLVPYKGRLRNSTSFWTHPDGTILSTAEALKWLKGMRT